MFRGSSGFWFRFTKCWPVFVDEKMSRNLKTWCISNGWGQNKHLTRSALQIENVAWADFSFSGISNPWFGRTMWFEISQGLFYVTFQNVDASKGLCFGLVVWIFCHTLKCFVDLPVSDLWRNVDRFSSTSKCLETLKCDVFPMVGVKTNIWPEAQSKSKTLRGPIFRFPVSQTHGLGGPCDLRFPKDFSMLYFKMLMPQKVFVLMPQNVFWPKIFLCYFSKWIPK